MNQNGLNGEEDIIMVTDAERMSCVYEHFIHPYLVNLVDLVAKPDISIEDVIFNDPATIVLWSDGTKTVVKAVNEKFDPEKGLAMAFTKKYLGNKGNYYNTIRRWTEKYSEEESAK